MEKLNVLNTFFNIIAKNEEAYIRDLFSSFDNFKNFREWLLQKNIHLTTLDYFDEELFRLVNTTMSAQAISLLIHADFIGDMHYLSSLYENRLQVVMIPSIGKKLEYTLDIHNDQIDYYELEDVFSMQDLSFFDPFPAFFTAMNNAEKWGGALVFTNHDEVFYPISSKEDKLYIEQALEKKDVFTLLRISNNDSYILQLSDLHLGPEKSKKGLHQLYLSLDELIPKLHSRYQLKVLVTGDLMDSPNRRNMYLSNDFMNDLKKKYKANVTFILGNHDVIVHGLNLLRRQKSKVVAYLLGESIKVIEDEKIIIIKIDTTSEGNLARGKVGKRQLKEIDDELEAIENIDDYTMIAMLHHHVYPIEKAQFLKTKWHEKTFINRIVETSKVLVDADLLIDWLNKKNIRYVLHGHKHLPFFRYVENKYIISGGASTGGLKERDSKYISYNLLKYDTLKQEMKTCMIFYDDKAKGNRQRVEVYLFEGDKNETIR
jgi:predicted phosphodiesterase